MNDLNMNDIRFRYVLYLLTTLYENGSKTCKFIKEGMKNASPQNRHIITLGH